MFSPRKEQRYIGHSSPGGSEPMNLGSPATSPKSQSNVNFLPPYLIGDVSTHLSPSSPIGGWSTPQQRHAVSFSTPHMSPIASRKSLYQSPNTSNALANGTTVVKRGGPPVHNVFETALESESSDVDFTKADDVMISQVPSNSFFNSSMQEYQQSVNGVLTPNKSFANSINNTSFASPAQIDPFYTQGESLTLSTQLDEAWVTVFGFPPAATSFILQQFSQYGKIIEHKLATSGNWIHIKYQSKLQAKKALSKNGKVFSGSIMVGVKPCIEMDIMNNSGKENSDGVTANFCQDELEADCFNSSRRSLMNIRPLTKIYTTPGSDVEVTPKCKPQPGVTSLVSKAMEYVFKW